MPSGFRRAARSRSEQGLSSASPFSMRHAGSKSAAWWCPYSTLEGRAAWAIAGTPKARPPPRPFLRGGNWDSFDAAGRTQVGHRCESSA
jgi:hypothetical protein